MATCSQTDIPILNQQVDPCNGIHTSTNCIFYPEAITYLFINPNEDLTAVIQAMVLSLQSNNTRTTQLEEENAVQADDIAQLKIDIVDLQDAVLEIQATPVDSRPYKVYTALLSQTGTNAPTATVLENTLGGTVFWSREAAGFYNATLAGVFTLNKTTVLITQGNGQAIYSGYGDASTNYVNLLGSSFSGMQIDNLLDRTTVEIRVYN